MLRPWLFNRTVVGLIVFLALLPLSVRAEPEPQLTDAAFRAVWQRTDQLVQMGQTTRPWLWGPAPLTAGIQEPYAEAPGGTRLVQYFDKSRMEINDPTRPQDDWYVTNGLLVKEMALGQIQVGDQRFENRGRAEIPVAGDLTNNPTCPTYAQFGQFARGGILALEGGQDLTPEEARGYPILGEPAMAVWYTVGGGGVDPALGERYPETAYAYYDEVTGMNVPGVFWRYLNQGGQVLVDNRPVQAAPLFNWRYVVGLPLDSGYWTKCAVNGQERDVLVQLYERRVLTYTPSNPPGWQVEMGNVGRHYRHWRYGTPLE